MRRFQRAATATALLAASSALCLPNKKTQQRLQWWKLHSVSAAGVAHCAAKPQPRQQLMKQQQVFVWGSRLGFPGGASEDIANPTEAAALSGESHDLEERKGERRSTLRGLFVCVGFFALFPTLQLTGLPVKGYLSSDFISSMAIGAYHAAFVSKNGRLYAGALAGCLCLVLRLPPVSAAVCCGDNLYGQCGLKPTDSTARHVAMREVVLPGEAKAAAAACGERHTLVLSSSGDTFAFGDDSKIQLAIGDTRGQGGADVGTTYKERIDMAGVKAPMRRGATYGLLERHIQHCPIPSLKPPACISPEAARGVATAVAASDFSSLILYQDIAAHGGIPRNVLLCCGEAARGQCGRTLQQQQQTLLPVQLPASVSPPLMSPLVSDVSCGSSHCLMALNQKHLVGWGFNDKGQVGAGPRGIVSPARCVRLPGEISRKEKKEHDTAGRGEAGSDTGTAGGCQEPQSLEQLHIAALRDDLGPHCSSSRDLDTTPAPSYKVSDYLL
ncbi:hypothetical protein cyc_03942 [Cyclospora cayetanensis]|uniref:Regulator of chromosome condensation (RCC1) repeat-containing protein n=1 Tax=Cyclospora cayetanensis TaxID=88456 RepID=A0A1D3CTI2_9EIME|nr:hypothetical protein cyc_03942 [Cyclospora cayetanensis]